MAKVKTKLGGKDIEVRVTDKDTYNFIDLVTCDIGDVEDNIVNTVEPPIIMPPMSAPQSLTIPKSIIASLLPCDKEGLAPCPKIQFKNSYEMLPEDAAKCDHTNSIIIPIPLRFNYAPTAIGYLILKPEFKNKCCCDAEEIKDENGNNTGEFEDKIEINMGTYFWMPEIKLPVPVQYWPIRDKDGCDGSQGCIGMSPQTTSIGVVTSVGIANSQDPSKGTMLNVVTQDLLFCCGKFVGIGGVAPRLLQIPCCTPKEDPGGNSGDPGSISKEDSGHLTNQPVGA